MKKFIALFIAATLCLTLFACQKNDQNNNTPLDTALSDDVIAPSDETIERAKKAYAAYISSFFTDNNDEIKAAISDAYVADIDKNGIPEVIFSYNFSSTKILSYSEKNGMSIVSPVTHSSTPANVFLSDTASKIYYIDCGHNQGSAWIMEGVCLSVTNSGLELVGTVTGDSWDDEPAEIWQDETLFYKTEETYRNKFDDEMKKLTGNHTFTAYNDVCVTENVLGYLEESLSVDFDETSKAYDAFKAKAISAIGEEPVSIFVNDYDRNSTYEAFALTSTDLGETGTGKIWFVSDKGEAKVVEENFEFGNKGNILECMYNSYFQIARYATSCSPTLLWEVNGSDCKPISTLSNTALDTLSTCSDNAYSNSLIGSINAYDAILKDIHSKDGVGHTYKPVFFYETPDGIKEYGAIEITQAQFDALGGNQYTDLINKNGYTVKNILARENGIISINFYNEGDLECESHYINLKSTMNGFYAIDDDAFPINLTDDFDENIGSGFYQTAYFTDIATYPTAADFAA